MDVTFSKRDVYFSLKISSSSLEGENEIEEQNWMVLLPDSSDMASIDAGCNSTALDHGIPNQVVQQNNKGPHSSTSTVPTNISLSDDILEVCINS